MLSRKISFDPAASTLGLFGFMAINVSLCGPHSLETSTLAPTLSDEFAPAGLSAAWFSRYWYLFHQVGLWELLFWANIGRAHTSDSSTAAIVDGFTTGPRRVGWSICWAAIMRRNGKSCKADLLKRLEI